MDFTLLFFKFSYVHIPIPIPWRDRGNFVEFISLLFPNGMLVGPWSPRETRLNIIRRVIRRVSRKSVRKGGMGTWEPAKKFW